MHLVFDCHHPKHYLTLRATARATEAAGAAVVWTTRDKDVTVSLIEADGWTPRVLTNPSSGLVGLFGELLRYDLRLWRVIRDVRPAAMIGNTVSTAHVGRVARIPAIVINDDDARANPQYPRLAYPLATRVVTPAVLGEDHGAKHRTYEGIHELAYLSPERFTPDSSVRDEAGLAPGERYSLVRTVSLRASHDIGETGLDSDVVRSVVEILSANGRVFISAEGDELPEDLRSHAIPVPPSRMHHLLAGADVLVSDSQTMSAEAAVLGVPSFRCNSFVGRLAYLEALEHRFGLTRGYRPSQTAEMLRDLQWHLDDPDRDERMRERRSEMLEQWSDPTPVFLEELRAVVPELSAT